MIFRKVALERLSSPEQLDQLMQVTDPRGWLALAALGALLVAALVWGVYGSVPTEAPGSGILIRHGGVSNLVATGNGQVEKLQVRVGDEIAKGQVVASIQQDALLRQVRDAKTKRADLEAQFQELARYAATQKRLKAGEAAQQRANLERSIEGFQKDLGLQREKVAAEQKLLEEGLITKQTLLATEQQLNTTRDQLASAQLELNGLELKRLDAEQQIEQQLDTQRGALRDVDLGIRELNAKVAENVNVVSSYAGRVLELMVDRGDVVAPGTPILSLEVVSEELTAVLFVPAATGKKVQVGMAARIAPSTVKREEYGTILGKVTWVAAFPSSQRGMVRLLGNEALVVKLMLDGPPIQVNVALDRDPRTPTGYRWSSSTGPNVKLSSGTLTEGSVVLDQDKPIRLLLPKLRQAMGS